MWLEIQVICRLYESDANLRYTLNSVNKSINFNILFPHITIYI